MDIYMQGNWDVKTIVFVLIIIPLLLHLLSWSHRTEPILPLLWLLDAHRHTHLSSLILWVSLSQMDVWRNEVRSPQTCWLFQGFWICSAYNCWTFQKSNLQKLKTYMKTYMSPVSRLLQACLSLTYNVLSTLIESTRWIIFKRWSQNFNNYLAAFYLYECSQ